MSYWSRLPKTPPGRTDQYFRFFRYVPSGRCRRCFDSFAPIGPLELEAFCAVAFRRFTGKPLRATYLSDLQRYADSLVGAPATRGRRLKTLKSLLSFATRRVTRRSAPARRSTAGPREKLAERILSERQSFASLTRQNQICCGTRYAVNLTQRAGRELSPRRVSTAHASICAGYVSVFVRNGIPQLF
jgi:hypothetical protein